MRRTRFSGDSAWATFVSVGPEDLERALTGPTEPPPARCRTLDDMSDAEITALELHYGCSVIERKNL